MKSYLNFNESFTKTRFTGMIMRKITDIILEWRIQAAGFKVNWGRRDRANRADRKLIALMK